MSESGFSEKSLKQDLQNLKISRIIQETINKLP